MIGNFKEMTLRKELEIVERQLNAETGTYIDFDGTRRDWYGPKWDELWDRKQMLEELILLRSSVGVLWSLDMYFGMCPCGPQASAR